MTWRSTVHLVTTILVFIHSHQKTTFIGLSAITYGGELYSSVIFGGVRKMHRSGFFPVNLLLINFLKKKNLTLNLSIGSWDKMDSIEGRTLGVLLLKINCTRNIIGIWTSILPLFSIKLFVNFSFLKMYTLLQINMNKYIVDVIVLDILHILSLVKMDVINWYIYFDLSMKFLSPKKKRKPLLVLFSHAHTLCTWAVFFFWKQII